MILKKINNDWYLFGEGTINRGDFFHCSIDDKIYRSSIHRIGDGWSQTTNKLIASSVKKDNLPLINLSELESKIEALKIENLASLSEDESDKIEKRFCKEALDKNKWSHLPYTVQRPHPIFFWQEVDSAIMEYRIKQSKISEIERTEFEAEFEIENGLLKIISLK